MRQWNVADQNAAGAPLTGHTNIVYSLAFSPDGSSLASAALDDTIRLWELSGRSTVLDQTGSVLGLAFNSSGTTLVASANRTVGEWDVTTGHRVGQPLRVETTVDGVAFAPDGATFIAAGGDATVHVWDAASLRPALDVGPLSTDGNRMQRH